MTVAASLTLLAAKVRELQRLMRSKISVSETVSYVTTTVTVVDAAAMKKAQNLSDVADVPTARNNILPAKTGGSLKVLRVNSGETDYELATITSGVTDHGALTGLGDDDHTQYHTNARGDARYDALGAAAAAQAASQPLDSDLTAIAALSTTSFGRSFLALADAAAGRTLLSLGTAAAANTGDFDAAGAAAAAQAASQPLDSDLTAIAALSTTSFGRSFLALADAAAGRTLLALGTAALLAGSGTNDAAYGGTITWTAGAAPSGASSLRQFFERVGNRVTFHIAFTFASAGTTITNVSFTFPTEFPTPVIPTGFTGASVRLYKLNATSLLASLTGACTNGGVFHIIRNAADNGFVIASTGTFTSGTYGTFIFSGSYFTAP